MVPGDKPLLALQMIQNFIANTGYDRELRDVSFVEQDLCLFMMCPLQVNLNPAPLKAASATQSPTQQTRATRSTQNHASYLKFDNVTLLALISLMLQ